MSNVAVYCYDKNGYYAGMDIMYNDILPNNSTTLVVPEYRKDQIPRFVNGVWILDENHKGEFGFVDNEPYEIKEYGSYPNGWTTKYVPTEEEVKENKVDQLMNQLKELDNKKIRALCAIATSTAIEADINRLNELNEQTEKIRDELHELLA